MMLISESSVKMVMAMKMVICRCLALAHDQMDN
jgi:hypothetical protein